MPNIGPAHTFVIAESTNRTATDTFGPFVPTGDQKGVRVYIDCTVDDEAASVVFSIQVRDPVGDAWHTLLDSAAIASVTTDYLEVYPGHTTVANEAIGRHIGKGFRVLATHADGDDITYSLTGEWLP